MYLFFKILWARCVIPPPKPRNVDELSEDNWMTKIHCSHLHFSFPLPFFLVCHFYYFHSPFLSLLLHPQDEYHHCMNLRNLNLIICHMIFNFCFQALYSPAFFAFHFLKYSPSFGYLHQLFLFLSLFSPHAHLCY